MNTEQRSKEPAPLSELQAEADAWIKNIGGGYFNELTNTAILAEEVGEVARIMARKYGGQKAKPGDAADLGGELCDVLFVLLCLANQTGIDLQQAWEQRMEAKTERDRNRFNK